MSIFKFNFTEEDLRENQRGLISPRQKERLQAAVRSARQDERRDTLIMAGVIFLVFGGILGLVLQDESARAVLFSNPGILVIFLVVLFLIVSVIARATFLLYRDMNRLEDSVLSSVSGVVHLAEGSAGEDNNLTLYSVFVGEKRFTFLDDMSPIFKEGEKYKVYYCESGMYKRVMSYEQLSK